MTLMVPYPGRQDLFQVVDEIGACSVLSTHQHWIEHCMKLKQIKSEKKEKKKEEAAEVAVTQCFGCQLSLILIRGGGGD